MKRIVFFCSALLIAMHTGWADADADFTAANEAVAAGDFSRAVELYETILQDAQSANTYYNLGNAYYARGEYGQAILQYARSLVLDPGNPDTLANLRLAREAAQAEAPERVWSERFAQSLGVNTWTWLAVVAFWGAFGLVLLPPVYGWRSPLRPLLLVACIITLLAGGLGLFGYHQLSREGIVTASDTPLQVAPTANSPAASFLQAGQAADILSVHGNFARIATPSGDEGWVSLDRFGPIWRR